jgi:tRNA (cytidine56-2'-O)-methyltransferase
MITILRLGHRIPRDKRVTTHVALVARAFGADRMLVGPKDEEIEKTVEDVVERFGGDFTIETGCAWRRTLATWQGKIVHLTMYGESLDNVISRIPRNEDILVVLGAEKMPPEVFKKAHFNVAVGSQPHSEVSALAVFLDRFFEGKELKRDLEGKLRIVPTPHGKRAVQRLPDRGECIRMLNDAGCDEAVISHCIGVNRLAVKLAKLCSADVELVDVASLLHDIGRSKGHGIMHGIDGAKILRENGLPKEVIMIVEKHIGAGLDSEEASRLGLPDGDFVPSTLEEKIVCHADSLMSHDKKIRLEELIKRFEGQGLEKYIENLKRLHAELSDACGTDLDEIALD